MDKQPLITNRFIARISTGIAILLCITILIYVIGDNYGSRMALGGHSEATTRHIITIGDQTLSIKANTIRFNDQRKDGPTDGISLYVSWPEFEGYQPDNRQKFNQTGTESELIFINIETSDGGGDMSARYNPIYKNFIRGEAEAGPANLSRYQMDPQSNFKDEILFTEAIIKERPFVILCLTKQATDIPNGANCQRDILWDNKLFITYRYSQALLRDWQQIEAAILNHLSSIRSAAIK